ncbi:hypothetical protein MNB_SV-5-977 [hydrothermal vent metagenome]|uniref:Uncharacterized protein n=1 Tax=hydrothermal vent metagenome TaxID=652676 RepID=A0A1W1EG94_9ZZZZ
MTQKKRFTLKFAAIALALGLFAPTINVENKGTAENTDYSVSVSLLNQAEARPKMKHRKARYNRNAKVNRHKKHNNRRYNDRRNDNTALKVLGGMAVGAAVVKALE